MTTRQLMFIRGARLVDTLNETSTYPQLMQNIEQSFDTTKRQNVVNQVHPIELEYTPYEANGVLEVKGVVKGTTGSYNTTVQFLDVDFTPGTVEFVDSAGETIAINPIRLAQHNCKVNCTCMDFYFRFALWNFDDDSLAGEMPTPYQRKTLTRPPVNPARVPGVCKHIISTVDTLINTGIVV